MSSVKFNQELISKTEKTFLYYKFNNIYFKVPTYGYIFKIIDFGRSIFDFHKKTFFNDNFSKHGEAEGQYHYPIPPVDSYKKNKYTCILNILLIYTLYTCTIGSTRESTNPYP